MVQRPNLFRKSKLPDDSNERFQEEIWGKLTEIHVPFLHQQHKSLVEYIVTTYTVMGNLKKHKPTPRELKELNEVLTKLKEYVVFHLTEEEQFMAKIGFPGLQKHKQAHAKFNERLLEISKEMEEIGVQYIVDLFFFIYSWLFEHINTMDTEYSDFYFERSREGK